MWSTRLTTIVPGTGRFSVIDQHGQVRTVQAKVTAVSPTGSLAQLDDRSGLDARTRRAPPASLSIRFSSWIRFAFLIRRPKQDSSSLFPTRPSELPMFRSPPSLPTAPTERMPGRRPSRQVATLPSIRLTADHSTACSSLAISGHSQVCVNGVAVIQPVRMTADGSCSRRQLLRRDRTRCDVRTSRNNYSAAVNTHESNFLKVGGIGYGVRTVVRAEPRIAPSTHCSHSDV